MNLCESGLCFGDHNEEGPVRVLAVVKDSNMANFSFYRQGLMYYSVDVEGVSYIFPVSLEDIAGASLMAQEKAITLMRYIRKAMKDQTFVKEGK